jgi:hypothetical protein
MAGLQRDGLKAAEVFKIRSTVERLIADGEEEDVAYALACREVVGVSAETFKRWKPDIFKLIKGEKTPADSLLSGSLDPAKSTNKDTGVFKRIEALGSELDAAKKDHGRVLSENEELKKKLADAEAKLQASVLGEDPPKTPAAKPTK